MVPRQARVVKQWEDSIAMLLMLVVIVIFGMIAYNFVDTIIEQT